MTRHYGNRSKPSPMYGLSQKSLERRRKAKEAQERAQEALREELAKWPTCNPRYAADLKTMQNWAHGWDVGLREVL